MKRSRLRQWAKWACTVAAGAMVVVTVFSGFCRASYLHTSTDWKTAQRLTVGGGLVTFVDWHGYDMMGVPMAEGWSISWAKAWLWGLNGTSATREWHAGLFWDSPNMLIGPAWRAGMSLLYPVILTTFPAALLWYVDRRPFGPGLCKKCGYDRRGLAPDAKCPECGTVPAPAAK